MSQFDQTPDSFASYIRQNKDSGRSTAVYVESNLAQEPPTGRSVAETVADRLNTESEDIVSMEAMSVCDEDRQQPDTIGTILVTLPPGSPKDEWQPVQRRLLSRVPRDTDVVVLVDTTEVPWFVKELCDIRIVATDPDEQVRCYRVKIDHYEGDVYHSELEFLDGE